MTPTRLLAQAPAPVRRWALHFECCIEDAVARFADELTSDSWVLDAGAGEGQYRGNFARQRYVGADLGVGDLAWDYSGLDAVADLTALPFRDKTFHAALNIVTLEHVQDPAAALVEIGRVLRPNGRLLLVAPLQWEEHQQPHDYFRYTQFGLRHLLERAGFQEVLLVPAGGYFRLVSRRLLNGLQFFMRGARWILFLPAAAAFIPLSLFLPLLEPLDERKTFTLGYVCTARKRF